MSRDTWVGDVRRWIAITSGRMLVGGAGTAVVLALACKRESPATDTAVTTTPVQVGSGPAVVASVAPAATVTSTEPSTAAVVFSPVPSSFDDAQKAEVKNAVGIGCEARSKGGWLQLLCRKKNSTGGTPVRALFESAELAAPSLGEPFVPPVASAAATAAAPVISSAAPAAGGSVPAGSSSAAPDADAGVPEFKVEPGPRGELTLLVPWVSGFRMQARVEWTDVAYDLIVDGTSAELKRPASLPLRKACAGLTQQSDAVVAGAKKGGGLTPADVQKLPKFGRCILAGEGAWALVLEQLSATGADASRALTLTLSAVRLDGEGQKVSAPYGQISIAPQGLSMPALMIFDYDADGMHELLVRYDVTARPSGQAAPQVLPGVLTLKNGKIEPFAVGELAGGAFSVEQLDSDMRPDVADYGPFVAWLGKDCGVAKCPSRLQGPRFFFHSVPGGKFERTGDAVTGALKRACPAQAKDNIVVTGAQGVNAAQTAERLVCALVKKVPPTTLQQQLTEAKAKLCTAGNECSLFTTLQAWTSLTPPTTL